MAGLPPPPSIEAFASGAVEALERPFSTNTYEALLAGPHSPQRAMGAPVQNVTRSHDQPDTPNVSSIDHDDGSSPHAPEPSASGPALPRNGLGASSATAFVRSPVFGSYFSSPGFCLDGPGYRRQPSQVHSAVAAPLPRYHRRQPRAAPAIQAVTALRAGQPFVGSPGNALADLGAQFRSQVADRPFGVSVHKTKIRRLDDGTAEAQMALAAADCAQRVARIVSESAAMGIPFTDPEFPPEDDPRWDAVLAHTPGAPRRFFGRGVQWQRLSALWPRARIFNDPTELGDVRQGALGSCFLLGALATVGAHGLVHPLVVAFDAAVGVYGLRFFLNGRWVYCLVDDYVPVRSGGVPLLSCSLESPAELWPMLFEKALAKLLGGFGALDRGLEGEALVDLTGGVPSSLRFDRGSTADAVLAGTFWTQLQLLRAQRLLMAAYVLRDSPTARSDGASAPAPGADVGLLQAHAYAVLGLIESPSRQQLVRLRDPWRTGGQSAWAALPLEPALAAELRVDAAQCAREGVFFMLFSHFTQSFSGMDMVALPERLACAYSARSAWHGARADACGGQSSLAASPQFELVFDPAPAASQPPAGLAGAGDAEARDSVVVCLSQPDVRLGDSGDPAEPLAYRHAIGLQALLADASKPVPLADGAGLRVVAGPVYQKARDVALTFSFPRGLLTALDSGLRCVLAVQLWEALPAQLSLAYHLRVYSSVSFVLLPLFEPRT